jgi:tRNA uridine 5-carboxymethylaminomethyl modification enzyme
LDVLLQLGLIPSGLVADVLREVETRLRYAAYVTRQESEVVRLRKLENREIPADVDYTCVNGLRSESRERLQKVRPRTVGQAGRVAGVTPADVSMLLVHLERGRRQAAAR